jgi:hypothetical protein
MATRAQLAGNPRSGARPLTGAAQAGSPRPAAAATPPASTSNRRASTAAAPRAGARTPARTGTAPQQPQQPAAAAPRDFSAGTEGAGALLALFLYPLAVNLLNGGPAQMWGWVKAKWLNQPYGAGPAGRPPPPAPATGVPAGLAGPPNLPAPGLPAGLAGPPVLPPPGAAPGTLPPILPPPRPSKASRP